MGPARADRGTYVSDPATEDLEPPYIAELRAPVRMVLGFDVGLGIIGATCVECERALGGLHVNVYGGALVMPRVAVLVDVSTLAHLLPVDDDTKGVYTSTLALAAARVWLTPTVWAQAGAGVHLLGLTKSGEDAYELVPGLGLALGNEVGHRPSSGIDAAVRIGAGRHHDDDVDEDYTVYSIAASIGWHWL